MAVPPSHEWLKGKIEVGQELFIAGAPAEAGKAPYFMTLVEGPVALRTGGQVPGPALVLDPRPAATVAGGALRASFVSINWPAVQLRITRPADQGYLSAGPSAGAGIANLLMPGEAATTLMLKEVTGLGVSEVRAEGRYALSTPDGQPVSIYRFLPVRPSPTADAGVQQTVRGVPYVVAEAAPVAFVPATIYDQHCQPVVDPAAVLGHAHKAAAGGGQRFFVSQGECHRGGWYAVCPAGQRCGKCYGDCPGGAACVVTYDKNNKKIRYSCGVTPGGDDSTPWYETWWIWLIIAVVVVALVVIILMLAHRASQTRGGGEGEGVEAGTQTPARHATFASSAQ